MSASVFLSTKYWHIQTENLNLGSLLKHLIKGKVVRKFGALKQSPQRQPILQDGRVHRV